MAQKQVRLIYSAATCQLRRTIVTDDEFGLVGHDAGPGEAVLDIPHETYVKFSDPVNGLPHLYALGAYISERTNTPYRWSLLVGPDNVVTHCLHMDPACGDDFGDDLKHLDHRYHFFHPHMPHNRIPGHKHIDGILRTPEGEILK